jgi:hypothetical protein
MAAKETPHVWSDLRGGQNSAQPPHLLGPTQCVAATNVEWYRAGVGRKRRGSRKVERSGGGSSLPSTKKFSTMAVGQGSFGKVVVLEPSDFTAWPMWGTSASFEWGTTATMPDTQASNACIRVFNGNFVCAYDSAVDRLHYLRSGGTAWRSGLAAPATPVVTESAGAITDNRKYRAVVYHSTFGWRSEPCTETGVITLTAEQASVAAPGAAPSGEDYDRWELQSASDDDNYATWWVIGTAVAANAIGDTSGTALHAQNLEPANELGLFTTPHSVKFLEVDDNRLLMAGSYEGSEPGTRVWFTPVLGDRDEGDDQRIVDTVSVSHWVDLDAGDGGGDITGFGPPVLGTPLAFKRTQIWRLHRTGIYEAPYRPEIIDRQHGTFGYRTVQPGEDAAGRPCLYFASTRGPYRVGVDGVTYLGAAIEDVWARVNQFGSIHTSQHAVYYPDKGQYWLWVSVDGATVPSVLLIYSVATDGWAIYTGLIDDALCSCLAPRYLQDTTKGITTSTVNTAPFVPYACLDTAGVLVECDAINPSTGVALDTDAETWSSGSTWVDGTAYAASVQTAPVPQLLGSFQSVAAAHIFADVAAGVTLSLTITPDYDSAQARTSTISLAASGSESRVIRGVDVVEVGKAKVIQATVGDASAIANQWAVHALGVRVQEAGSR